MRYLITTKGYNPFYCNHYEFENDFNLQLEMIVYDLGKAKYTTDGINWIDIEFDHL